MTLQSSGIPTPEQMEYGRRTYGDLPEDELARRVEAVVYMAGRLGFETMAEVDAYYADFARMEATMRREQEVLEARMRKVY